jgi:hypothetical protein
MEGCLQGSYRPPATLTPLHACSTGSGGRGTRPVPDPTMADFNCHGCHGRPHGLGPPEPALSPSVQVPGGTRTASTHLGRNTSGTPSPAAVTNNLLETTEPWGRTPSLPQHVSQLGVWGVNAVPPCPTGLIRERSAFGAANQGAKSTYLYEAPW